MVFSLCMPQQIQTYLGTFLSYPEQLWKSFCPSFGPSGYLCEGVCEKVTFTRVQGYHLVTVVTEVTVLTQVTLATVSTVVKVVTVVAVVSDETNL